MKIENWIRDLKAGMLVDELFSVKYKYMPKKYVNGWMFEFGLGDISGEVRGVYWGDEDEAAVANLYNSFKENDVIKVRGTVKGYHERLSININEANGIVGPIKEFDKEDFVGRTEIAIEDLFSSLLKLLGKVKDPHLKDLIGELLNDEVFTRQFKEKPASLSYHHAYIGGLLEHTLNVVRISDELCNVYPLDRDLVLVGAFLHDVGKIYELSITTNIQSTEEGTLIGHIAMGASFVAEKISRLSDFPDDLRLKLLHIIWSHHSSYDKGSPMQPKTIEALAVHYADEIDAYFHMFYSIKHNAKTEDFRIWDRRLKQEIYLK